MEDCRGGRVVTDITRSTVARDGDGNYAGGICSFSFSFMHFRRRYRHENET